MLVGGERTGSIFRGFKKEIMVYVADANGSTDGTAYKFLQMIPADIPIVLVSRVLDYKFNESLLHLKGKKWILVDFIEFGWQWNGDAHHWGVNTANFDFLSGVEWERIDNFIASNSPAMAFKRELLKKDVTDICQPIEYPGWTNPYPVNTKEEFDARPIDVFNFWGRSHEARVQLHGDIWKGASAGGYSVCDNIYYFNEFMKEEKGRKWVSFWMPHYGRTDISNILAINGLSKLSMSLPGAGVKCFRSTGESPVNSVMVCKEDDLAWSYPWVDSENCFKFEDFGGEINTIKFALTDKRLYEIYREGIATADKYRVNNYINNYILPLINKL